MFSLACCLKQNAQRSSRARRNILMPKSNFSPSQITRNQYIQVLAIRPIVTQTVSRISLRSHAPTPREYTYLSGPASPWNSQTRYFSTSPNATSSRWRKLGKFFDILFKMGSAAFTLAIVWAMYELWASLRSPELSTWPESLRMPLISARMSQATGRKGAVVDNLTRVWKLLQDIPIDRLDPNAAIKMLGIAIWFADTLEKDDQSIKAYRLLEQAIDLYHTRFKKASVPQVDARKTSDIMEKRHLISAFLKLSNLSGTVAPKFEGKWLTCAIRESIGLLPSFGNVDMSNYAQLIADVESFSSRDTSFAGLSDELTAQIEKKEVTSSGIDEDQATPFSSTISVDEILNTEDVFPLPRWHVRDLTSAIAVPFENVGMYAERHGSPDIALRSYDLACDILRPILEPIKLEDATTAYWSNLSHLLRIGNRHADLHLRDMESEAHAAEWLYRLHEAFKDCRLGQEVMNRAHQLLEEEKAGDWKPKFIRKYEILSEILFEYGIAVRLAGTYFLNIGDLKRANGLFQNSLIMVRSGVAPDLQGSAGQIDAFMLPARMGELKKVERALEAVKKSIAEGRTSIKSQMNAVALKEWEEAVKRKPNVQEDEPTSAQN